MYKEIEVDRNLYHLLDVLFDLDHYKFDSDVIRLLNELKVLVDEKLWANSNLNGFDIMDENIIVKFLLEK